MTGLRQAKYGAFLDLRNNCTFEYLLDFHGNWRMSGNQIILTFAFGAYYLQMEGIDLRAVDG
jgi:hypothetical protein